LRPSDRLARALLFAGHTPMAQARAFNEMKGRESL
jgi:hypothetical protein